MCDNEVNISSVHPLGEAVGYSLWQSAAVGSPGQNNLRSILFPLSTFLFPPFFDGDEVGEGLKRMHGSCLHSEDRTARILDKLIQHSLCIVILTIGESSKAAHTDEVAVTTHHGDCLQQVLTLVSVHDDTTLCLQFPGTSVHVEHDDIHAEVHGCLLGRETGTQ